MINESPSHCSTEAVPGFPHALQRGGEIGAIGTPLTQGEVFISLGNVKRDAALMHHLTSHLTLEERQRADRLPPGGCRDRYLLGRGLLRELLGKQLRSAPAAIEIILTPLGKPMLAGFHANSGIHFNLSHSGEWVLIGISNGGEIGVDVEELKQERPLARIAQRTFGRHEILELNSAHPDQFVESFYRIWTLREAYLKGTGDGIARGIGQDVARGANATLSHANPRAKWQAWRINSPALGAVALPLGDWKFRQHT